MRAALLIMILLLVLCFGFVTWLQPRHEARLDEFEPGGDSTLASLLGDGRKFVSDYFFTEADVYFHSGYYPSIFDQARKQEEADSDVSHPEESGGEQEEKGFMGEPLDWIDRFGRHFLPSRHSHLPGEKVRELLPWLKLSTELDPHNVKAYMNADYWLRNRLGNSEDAEVFVREGVKNNPHSPDLLYALGQIYLEDRKDYPHAKNLLVAAKKWWHIRDDPRPEKSDTEETKDHLLLEQILGGLVKGELAMDHPEQALAYMKELKTNASDPEGVQKQIDQLEAQIKSQPAHHN